MGFLTELVPCSISMQYAPSLGFSDTSSIYFRYTLYNSFLGYHHQYHDAYALLIRSFAAPSASPQNQVYTAVRAHDVADLADVQCKGRLLEGPLHLVAAEPAQIAAL